MGGRVASYGVCGAFVVLAALAAEPLIPAIPAIPEAAAAGVATAGDTTGTAGPIDRPLLIQRMPPTSAHTTTRKIASTPADVLQKTLAGVPESSLPGGAACAAIKSVLSE